MVVFWDTEHLLKIFRPYAETFVERNVLPIVENFKVKEYKIVQDWVKEHSEVLIWILQVIIKHLTEELSPLPDQVICFNSDKSKVEWFPINVGWNLPIKIQDCTVWGHFMSFGLHPPFVLFLVSEENFFDFFYNILPLKLDSFSKNGWK